MANNNSATRMTTFLAQDLLTVPRTGRRNDCFHSPDEDFWWKSNCWGTNNFLVVIDEFITAMANT